MTRPGKGRTRRRPQTPVHSTVTSSHPSRLPRHPGFLFNAPIGSRKLHRAPHWTVLLRLGAGTGGGLEEMFQGLRQVAQTHLPTLRFPQTSGAPLLRQLLGFLKCPLCPEAWDEGPGLEPENPAVSFAWPA